MIDIKELRIGNWIASDIKRHRVVEIKKDSVVIDRVPMNNLRRADESREFRQLNTGSIAHDFDELHPIPLTSELLEKCGFSKLNDNHFVKEVTDGIVDIELWLDATTGKFQYTLPSSLYVTIHSLHRLQNLYFALTGEELEVNL